MPQGPEAGGCLTPSSAVAGAVALKRAWFGAPCAYAQPDAKRMRASSPSEQDLNLGLPQLDPATVLQNVGWQDV
jgi:hypothetical protein